MSVNSPIKKTHPLSDASPSGHTCFCCFPPLCFAQRVGGSILMWTWKAGPSTRGESGGRMYSSVPRSVKTHYQAAEPRWTEPPQLLDSRRASDCREAACLLVLPFGRRHTLGIVSRQPHKLADAGAHTACMQSITHTNTHTRCADGWEIDTCRHAHTRTHNKCGIGTDLAPGLPARTPRSPAWHGTDKTIVTVSLLCSSANQPVKIHSIYIKT